MFYEVKWSDDESFGEGALYNCLTSLYSTLSLCPQGGHKMDILTGDGQYIVQCTRFLQTYLHIAEAINCKMSLIWHQFIFLAQLGVGQLVTPIKKMWHLVLAIFCNMSGAGIHMSDAELKLHNSCQEKLLPVDMSNAMAEDDFVALHFTCSQTNKLLSTYLTSDQCICHQPILDALCLIQFLSYTCLQRQSIVLDVTPRLCFAALLFFDCPKKTLCGEEISGIPDILRYLWTFQIF